jgi:hypothetical protein
MVLSIGQKLALTVFCAATLLFVVLYPYTPTPIAEIMVKILVAVVVVFALVTAEPIAADSALSDFPREFSLLIPGYKLLDLICVRLR